MAEKGRMQSLFDAFDRLSGREKVMVGGLVGAFSLTVVTIIWLVFSSQINALEERNTTARSTMAEVMTLKDAYLAEKAKLDAKKELLDNNRVRLATVMEAEAKRLGIEIEDFKENKRYITENHRRARPRDDAEGAAPAPRIRDLVEVSQTVTMRRLSLEQLANFLAAMQKRDEPIRVTDLDVAVSAGNRQELRTVKVTVATYRNEEVKL